MLENNLGLLSRDLIYEVIRMCGFKKTGQGLALLRRVIFVVVTDLKQSWQCKNYFR